MVRNLLKQFSRSGETKTEGTGIDRARSELRHVEWSIEDLNRRIAHLEHVADKWRASDHA